MIDERLPAGRPQASLEHVHKETTGMPLSADEHKSVRTDIFLMEADNGERLGVIRILGNSE